MSDSSTTTETAPTRVWRDALQRLDAADRLVHAVEGGARLLHVHKLVGSAKTLMAAGLRRRLHRPVLYVTLGDERAEAARLDLEEFLDEPVWTLAEHRTEPYAVKSPHTDVSAARLETLAQLVLRGDGMVVTTAAALLEYVAGPERLRESLVQLRTGDAVNLETLLTRLTYLGYERSGAVEEVGDYALRGGILDVYSLGGTHPLRIEMEYDEVASIREFDVHTQRSLRVLPEAVIVPRYELLLDQDRIDAAVARMTEEDAGSGAELEAAFEAEVHPAGIERMAGRLDQDLGSALRYFPAETVIVLEEPDLVRARAESYWDEVVAAHTATVQAFPRVSPPEALYTDPGDWDALWGDRALVRMSDLSPDPGRATAIPVRSTPPLSFGRKIELWRDYLRDLHAAGTEITIACDNEGQRTRLHELLVDEGLEVRLVLGILDAGFVLEDARVAVLTDHQFFGRPRRRVARRRFHSGFGLKQLRSLVRGQHVVHIEHGIGRYLGLARLEVNGHLTDVLHLEYHGGDKLYVPVDQLDLIQKYSSEEGKHAVLSRLGGSGWSKTKSRAKRAIKEMAGELLRLYALRRATPGHAFTGDTAWQNELEGSFPYEETPDQAEAVRKVKTDMESTISMDHLVCGDVGYGKTEVAVRAAFKAMQDGKQVAMLVPTTILAEQHFNTFRERYEEFPVRVDMLSRFRTTKERAELLEKLAAGELDMVIGTHALLGKRVRFKDLGLLVVDEEQRFGVAHKEKLKQLRASVDVLTLTATPIPRTLNLSLLGVRDITVIQTPPAGRMPVQTEITEFDRELIQEALLREADRGGQSFFVHNRVHSIQSMGTYLQRLCPQLRFGVAHGQMPERQLEKVMHEFIAGRLDVLVSTMIIENGLDIPSVNTMLVNRADALGLSQLYQLRGRVGRSTAKAYCSFLVPTRKSLTENAMKRLRAIAEFDELGSGFALAMRDLEIRGAGNILGGEQSGHIVSVGFDMYCRLVDEAVRELKGLPLEDRPEPRMSSDVDAYLPDEYVEDAEEKVAFYKRLADASEPDEIDTLQEELEDRFGRLVPPAVGLFDLRRARVQGAELGLVSITVRGGKIELEWAAPPSPEDLRAFMTTVTAKVEFVTTGKFALKARGGLPEALELLAQMRGESAEDGDEDQD